jgi:hypothetical protein
MDAVDRHLVDGGFGFPEALKHRFRALAPGRRKRRAIDQGEDFRKAPMRVMRRVTVMMIVRRVIVMMVFGRVIVLVDGELGSRHTGAENLLRVHVDARAEREAAERAGQIVQRQTGIDERAERHVAGYAGEAIEVQDFRHYSRPDSLKLQYRTSPRMM